MTLIQISISYLVLTTLNSSVNPVKLSVILILLGLALMINLYLSFSSSWLSSIFFMIFIGGIMIMFMILSSLLPNEKNLKNKKVLAIVPLVMMIFVSSSTTVEQAEMGSLEQLKLIFTSSESFEMLMMVILLYFLCFIFIVTKSTSSLRSFICYSNLDFVNLYPKGSNVYFTKEWSNHQRS